MITYDTASSFHRFQLSSDAEEHSPSIDVHHAIPALICFRHHGRINREDPSHIDSSVQVAKGIDGFLNPLVDTRTVADVYDSSEVAVAAEPTQCCLKTISVVVG